jgi:hypothetical protein
MRLIRPKRGESSRPITAFLLVEAVVGFAIVGLLFIGLFSGLAWGFAMVEWSRENARATQVMLDKMEQFRLFKWSDIVSGSVPTSFIEPFYENASGTQGFNYTGTVTLASAPLTEPYADHMRLVTVGVQWSSGGQSHTRTISTLVAQSGLQKYLF